jgi:hypothetical protein
MLPVVGRFIGSQWTYLDPLFCSCVMLLRTRHLDFDRTKNWVKFYTRHIEGGIGQMKLRDIFRIEPSTIRVDHAKSWARSVRGSFEIQVVGLWSSCLDGRHLGEFKTEGAQI